VADLSDVENAVVAEVIGGLYPNGTSQASAVGVTCRAYRGWPSPAALNSDLTAGVVNVTVFPATVPDEVPDSYFDKPYAAVLASSLVATVALQTVTLSGLAVVGQLVGLLIDGAPFSYTVNAGDTAEGITANLAALINETKVSTFSGPTLTIPSAITLIARIVVNTTVSRELRRQRREIQVNCWCPSPQLRDAVCSIVDQTISGSPFIALLDGTKAHVRYVSTQVFDQSQNALLYRRDLHYKFEYTMISTTVAPVMLFGDLVRNATSLLV
jgi:hypothetical protein